MGLGQGKTSHSVLLWMLYATVQGISIWYDVILKRPESGICELSGTHGL